MSEELNNVEVKNFEEGDKVTGTVTSVEDKQVYMGIPGSKLDGVVPISELSNVHVEIASDVVKVGDTLDLIVTKVEEDILVLSKRKVDAEKAVDDIKAKFDTAEVFEAEVSDVVKGGLVVDLGVRAFVPASLVEDHFVEDFADYKGKTLTFKVVEFEPENNRVILSHRAVVEADKEAQKKELLKSLKEGDTLTGKVERLADFGAFIDIGGIDGLVHISQISHSHIATPADVLNEGDEVEVKVLDVNEDEKRLSLSIKALQDEPVEEPDYELPEENTGFQMGDLIGDKLKDLKNDNQ